MRKVIDRLRQRLGGTPPSAERARPEGEEGTARVVIYTTMFCGFCWRAKALLEDKGVDYDEIDVTFDSGRRQRMTELTGGESSVPQIFVDGRNIGGSDELHALERAGELDRVLAGAS